MFREPGLAIVAEDKAMHGLVSPVYLHLYEASLVAAADLAQKQTLELVALCFNLFVFPVGAPLPQSVQLHLVPLLLKVIGSQFASFNLQELLWCHLLI